MPIMKIIEHPPADTVAFDRYQSGLNEAFYRVDVTNYLATHIKRTDDVTVRLRLLDNRNGDCDADYAGDFLLTVEDLTETLGKRARKLQPGMMMVRLALSPNADREAVDPQEYYVTPKGILLPTRHIRKCLSGREDGYFPVQTEVADLALPS